MNTYEQKYKEALEWMRSIYPTMQGADKEDAEHYFPELRESEDERIRKGIICGMNALKEQHKETFASIPINDCIAWLEKQGEPQDKGEISDGYHTFNELYYYRMLYNAAFFNMLPKEWVHKSKKHHDGEDCFGGGWFIVMANLPTGQISNHYELKDWNLFQIPEKEVADKWDGHTPQEAADRLHKYLLEKQGEQKSIKQDTEIHDLWVYIREWNDRFGRLPKDEDELAACIDYVMKRQKPTDKIEPKFKVGDWITNGEYIWKVTAIYPFYILQSLNGDVVNDTTYHVDVHFHLWTIQDAKKGDILQANKCTLVFDSLTKDIDGNTVISSWYFCDTKTFYGWGTSQSDLWSIEGVVPATKEQCDFLFQKMKESGYEWNAEKKELRKIEQKPAWSEEDEKMVSGLVSIVEDWYNNQSEEEKEYYGDCGYVNFLESLKGRVQPKQEWGEYDKIQLSEAIQMIEANGTWIRSEDAVKKVSNWLKSLKPNHWKPSEEQMGALKNRTHGLHTSSETRKILESLINDLEKL